MMPKQSHPAAAMGLITLLVAPAPVAALTQEHVLRPHQDRIAQCEVAGRELARQATVRQAELEVDLAFVRGLQQELARGAARLDELHARDRDIAERAEAVAPSLAPHDHDQASVPQYGFGVFGYFQQRRDETNAAIEAASGAVRRGETSFYVAGQSGWLSGQSLEARIAAAQAAIATHRDAVERGAFGIRHPGMAGTVNAASIETCITTERDRIAALSAEIAAGEYRVSLPVLGTVTRNGLNAMIGSVDDDIAALEAQHQRGEMSINRAGLGGSVTRAMIDERIARNEAAQAALRTTVSEGSFGYGFPGISGRLTATALSERIAQEQARIADLERRRSDGSYTVSIWGTRREAADMATARERLALPDCRDNGPSPCLNPSDRPYWQALVRRIPATVGFEIWFHQRHIAWLEAWRSAIDQHAEPEFQRLRAERAQLDVLLAEFDLELAERRATLQARREWLLANFDFIP